jgi:CRP-like cAMP-binding protein
VLLAAAYAGVFTRIDRTTPPPGPEIELLRSLPMFEHVSLATVEHVARLLEPRAFEQGDVVMAEGEPGTTFHLIASGRAGVTVHGVAKPDLQRGDGFGEIALLRDVPRTATVSALTPLETLTLSAADFCSVLTIQQHSVVAAHEVARRRLASDPGSEGVKD